MEFDLHQKQSVAFKSLATEILYGGAAGGGKSHLMRVIAIAWCILVPGIQVYLFRRTFSDLWKNHMEGASSFPIMLGDWIGTGFAKINYSDKQIIFGNGSKVHLCHCEHEKDMYKYQGAEINALLIDELTHFTDKIYRFLRGRCRLGALKLPKQLEGQYPKILSGANPGGIGHHWVKKTFVDRLTPLIIERQDKKEGGMLRQYIPAKLSDNPTMDADYEDKLLGLGNEALIKAMLDGDWNIVAGAYFDCWDVNKHVIHPFSVPADWVKFRSFDWGSAKPFSVGWWAIADGNPVNDVFYPRGALIRYREWYGMGDEPNVGLKMTVEQLADGILSRERGDKIEYGVADPSIWKVDGGISIAERFRKKNILWRKADNSRINGWDELRHRLIGEDDAPLIYFFNTCHDSIRTLPALQHDENKPEDVNSDMEDHAPDDIRYGCMSRPRLKEVIEKKQTADVNSIEWLLERTNKKVEKSIYRR